MDVLVLSERDSRAFVEALNNPPPPSPALLRALQRSAARVEQADRAGDGKL